MQDYEVVYIIGLVIKDKMLGGAYVGTDDIGGKVGFVAANL